MNRLLRLLPVATVLVATSCSDLLGVGSDRLPAVELEGVKVQADSRDVTIHNGRPAGIRYTMIEEDLVPLWDFPCWLDDPRSCSYLWAGATLTVPRSEVFFRDDSESARLYWWHMLPDGNGGLVIDSIRLMQFRLR